jgi:Asp-tRNA(Asn)/Glu-tRNA(Gln) amidotransferase A subunit family amidase
MSAADLHTLGVADLARRLRAREVSAVELAQALGRRIDAHAGLGAFLARDEALTLAQARAADARLAAGDGAPLLGVPIAHKDIFVTRGWRPPPARRCCRATPAPSTPPWSTGWRRPAASRWAS